MAMKYKSRHLKPHDAVVFRFSGEIEDDGNTPETCRQKLDVALNRPCTQGLIVTLVFADLLIVTVLLLIDLKVIQVPPGGNQSYYQLAKNIDEDSATPRLVEAIFHDIQLAVISIFLLEVLLRIVAQAVDMLDDRWQIFDCLVVLVTFALYVSLTVVVKGRTFTYPSGYVIALRLWRMPRIYRVVVWPYRSRVTSEAIAHRQTIKFTEENLHAAQQKLDQQQNEIEYLKEQLRKTYSARMHEHRYSEVEAAITDENFLNDSITPSYLLPGAPHLHSDHDGMRLHLYAPNGTIFTSHTPRSSLSSNIFPVISLPGTPQSVSSSRLADEPADGARERYPDVVEDTQSADTVSHSCRGDSMTGRASSDPNLFCGNDKRAYSYKDKHKSSQSDDRIHETNIRINSAPSKRRVTKDNVARRHSDTMVASSEVTTTEDGENAKENREDSHVTMQREHTLSIELSLSECVMSPEEDTTNRDREKLIPAIPDADCLGATYVNAAFSSLPPLPALPPPSPAPTGEEEEQEILRIAQVPFHLVDSCDETYLEEGIPMTSL